jgi:hypothetical protein
MNAKGQKEQGKWIRASTEGTINGDFSFKESDVLCMCIQKVGTWPQMKKGKKNCKTMRESLLFCFWFVRLNHYTTINDLPHF